MPITIVELPEYMKDAKRLLSSSSRNDLIFYVATHPKAGDLIQGTGGIRKLRWARKGKGKSGGVRVIYYYHKESMPLFLLNIFGKNQQANLSMSERKNLAKLTKLLVKSYTG